MLSNEDFIKKVGLRIKKLRKEQKLTQLDLSIKSNMEENALQRIETGRTNPTLKTLLKITTALNIKFHILFTDID